jgi:hypothetical protein
MQMSLNSESIDGAPIGDIDTAHAREQENLKTIQDLKTTLQQQQRLIEDLKKEVTQMKSDKSLIYRKRSREWAQDSSLDPQAVDNAVPL